LYQKQTWIQSRLANLLYQKQTWIQSRLANFFVISLYLIGCLQSTTQSGLTHTPLKTIFYASIWGVIYTFGAGIVLSFVPKPFHMLGILILLVSTLHSKGLI
jgi:hypothetical protein